MQDRNVLSAAERNRCLQIGRDGNDRARARRAFVLLRLDDGAS
jgi:hypothetical protein